jgi:hypothetical protein
MVPSRVVIGFVDSEAVAGSYKLNPFNFEHFNLNQIYLFVDNIPVSGNVMKLNFDGSQGRTLIPALIASSVSLTKVVETQEML